LAETHVQACVGLDASRSSALARRPRSNLGDDGESLQLKTRPENGGARSGGHGTRALARDGEAPDAAPRTVCRGVDSPPDDIIAESANPFRHKCSALHPRNMDMATLNGGRRSCRSSADTDSEQGRCQTNLVPSPASRRHLREIEFVRGVASGEEIPGDSRGSRRLRVLAVEGGFVHNGAVGPSRLTTNPY
jgi:hypothetical protein